MSDPVDKKNMTNEALKKYEDDYTKYMTKPWQKFFSRMQDHSTLKIVQWSEVHLLGHICKRYEDVFNTKFAISVKGAPSKCTEIYQIKQIMFTIQTNNMAMMKEYVDWVFDHKIVPNKVKLKKIGFFITAGFATEFFLDRKEKMVIKRSTPLPEDYIKKFKDLGIDAETYGDIAFIKMAANRYSVGIGHTQELAKKRMESENNIKNTNNDLINKIESTGFDISVLDNLAQ